MPQGPPKWLEQLAGVLIPPACREEVLGDLHERYKNPGQYARDMISTVPFVILSRIRRTTDAQLLVMEALLVYGSFLAAAWYQEPSLVSDQRGLLHLMIPAGITFVFLLVDNAYVPARQRSAKSLVAGGGLFALFLALGVVSMANAEAFFSSIVLVFGLRFVFEIVADRRESAAGPAAALKAEAVEGPKAYSIRPALKTLIILGIIALLAEIIREMPRAIYLVVVVFTWAAGLRYLRPY